MRCPACGSSNVGGAGENYWCNNCGATWTNKGKAKEEEK